MKIVMIGAGYVGLVSGVCLSDFGHDVVCVDTDADRVASLGRGEVPIYEPGLEALMARCVARGTLSFTTELEQALAGADAAFIAVGTPSRRGDGRADLSYVDAVARDIAQHAAPETVIVTKSTVPVGTHQRLRAILSATAPDKDFPVASNPEFLREGSAIEDFMRPDRVVVGVSDSRAEAVLREVYRPLSLRDVALVVTDLASAEATKYAANAFLAMKISFINEMAQLCERAGADVKAVARGMGLDKRIAPMFLHAGPGYGGSCFPKDTAALAMTARDHGMELSLVETAMRVNEGQKAWMADKIRTLCGGVAGKRIAVLGVTFKPETDDMRAAPALQILPALHAEGAEIVACDPQAGPGSEARDLLGFCTWADTAYAAAQGADAVVLLTEWNIFRGLDLPRLASGMAVPRFADLRNVYEPAHLTDAGFIATASVGRGMPEAGSEAVERPSLGQLP